MNKYIILSILFCIFIISKTYSQCELNFLSNIYSKFYKIRNELRNRENDVDIQKTGGIYQELLLSQVVCDPKMKSYVKELNKKNISLKSRHCIYQWGSNDWKTDPCCNPELTATQCCRRRSLTVERTIAKEFESSKINSECKHPDLIKKLIRKYFRKYQFRKFTCNSSKRKKVYEILTSISKLHNCFWGTVSSKKPCNSDSDCDFKCDPNARVCQTPGYSLDANHPYFTKCMLKSIPRHIKKTILLKYFGKGKIKNDFVELTKKILNDVTSEMCLSNVGILSNYNTQQDCLNVKKCSDGNTTCSDNNKFCGAYCYENGICRSDLSKLLNIQTEEECNKYVNCYGPNGATTQFKTESECINNKMCSDKRCHNDFGSSCSSTKCSNYGRCKGFPIYDSACVVKAKPSPDGVNKCENGWTDTEIGCVHYSYNQNQCSSVSGSKWVSHPKTQQECFDYKKCYEARFGRFTLKDTEEKCKSCRGHWRSLFTWEEAKWIPYMFDKTTKWMNREMKSEYYWKKGADWNKYNNYLLKMLSVLYNEALLSEMDCYYAPIMKFYSAVACDCGTNETIKSQCLKNGWKNFKIADVVAFFTGEDLENTIVDSPDMTIEILNTTVSEEEDHKYIEINKEELLDESDADVITIPDKEEIDISKLPPEKTDCPVEFGTIKDGFCYIAVNKKKKWKDAVNYCESEFNAQLTEIQSQEENKFIVDLAEQKLPQESNRYTNAIWIAFSDLTLERNWTLYYSKKFWYKGQQNPGFYENWDKTHNEPNSAGDEDCCQVFTKTGDSLRSYWNDIECHYPNRFICKRKVQPKIAEPVQDNQFNTDCPTTLGKIFNRKCFIPINEYKSWADARDHCETEFQGHLPEIHNEEENNFLRQYAEDSFKQYSNRYRNAIWLDFNDNNKEGNWTWATSKRFWGYTNWDTIHNEPNNYGTENCGQLYTNPKDKLNGFWNDYYCKTKLRFMCQKEILPDTDTTGDLDTVEVQNNKTAIVGQVIGSGYTVSGLLGRDVKICVAIDSDIKIKNQNYTKIVVTTKDDKGIHHPLESKDVTFSPNKDRICWITNNDGTYYPSIVHPKFRSIENNKIIIISGSMRKTFSIFALLIASITFLMF